jgi:hypothetical protein
MNPFLLILGTIHQALLFRVMNTERVPHDSCGEVIYSHVDRQNCHDAEWNERFGIPMTIKIVLPGIGVDA